ncbi:MAG: hypothetical protein HQL25_01125 [Candidatus Omnitrophica bacterium]|nr:hypothetical protein [Candidatus Omnitrophota bacterium]
MIDNKLPQNRKELKLWLFTRMLFLYLCVFIFALPFIDIKNFRNYINGLHMNYCLPVFKNIVELEISNKPQPIGRINSYIYYYKLLQRASREKSVANSTLAFLYAYKSQINNSVKNYELAFKENPTFKTFAYNLGLAYSKQGKFQKSNEILLRNFEYSFDLSVAFIDDSFAYQQILGSCGLYYKSDIQKIIISRNSDAHLLVAQNYLMLQDYTKLLDFSLKCLKDELIYNPEVFLYYAGVAEYNLNNPQKAKMYLETFINKTRDDPDALYFLALIYKANNEQEKANQLIARALSAKAQNTTVIQMLLQQLKFHVL